MLSGLRTSQGKDVEDSSRSDFLIFNSVGYILSMTGYIHSSIPELFGARANLE